MIHAVERSLKDLGEKVDAAERAKAESAIADLRTALKGDDRNVIEKKTEALAQASAGIAQRAYEAGQAPPEGAAAGGAQQPSGAAAGGQGQPGRDDVVDAEFEEVKDKGRKAS
jgi:molecular chaperone DnaK